MLQGEIIGNLGSDAEVKEFQGNRKYVSFNVAHTEYRKDAVGNRVKSTVWVSVLWYGDGGNLLQYLKKGSNVFVRGRLSVGTWKDRNGNIQTSINISASEVTLCGSRQDSQQNGQQSSQGGYHNAEAPQQTPPSQGEEEDLPF